MTETKNRLRSIYLVYSAHRLLLADALERLAAGLGDNEDAVMNISRFTAGEDDFDDILNACQELSFLGGQRLVVVAGLLKLDSAAQKALVAYVDNPNPQTVLVLTETISGKPDERRLKKTSLYQACDKSAEAKVYEYSLKSSLPGWVKSTFAGAGKEIEPTVANYLITWIGSDLDRLKSEIEKIASSTSETKITLVAVKETAVPFHEAEVFDLVNAVVDRDTETSLTLLGALLERDASGGSVFGLLERQFQLIFAAKTKGRGLNGQKLAGAVGVSPGQAFFLEKQSRAFALQAIRDALALLVETDYKRKSSPIPPRLLLESLIVDLCRV